MEYLTFKFGFCVRTSADVYPCIQILIDQVSIIDELCLNQAGSVDNPTANIQWVTIQSPIADNILAEHTIKVQALNINDSVKNQGDFGFQVREVHINGIFLENYCQNSTVYKPIYSPNYISDFLQPANKLNEIEYINNYPYHVERGEYANYVNSKNGWFELKFKTPLYNWIAVENNFGAIHRWLMG